VALERELVVLLLAHQRGVRPEHRPLVVRRFPLYAPQIKAESRERAVRERDQADAARESTRRLTRLSAAAARYAAAAAGSRGATKCAASAAARTHAGSAAAARSTEAPRPRPNAMVAA
jgi:hypothetical protein